MRTSVAAARLPAVDPSRATPATTAPDEPGWLSSWRAGPVDGAEALSRFDSLPGLEPEAMIGRWRGAGLRTGHPLDGLLEALGWYGKAFESADCVHPLLFRSRSAAAIPLDPAMMPVGLALRWPGFAGSHAARMAFAAARPLLRSHRPAARLRRLLFRGRQSAAMVYDRQPITDHFRRIDDTRVLGLMERRSMERPFFFLLMREQGRCK